MSRDQNHSTALLDKIAFNCIVHRTGQQSRTPTCPWCWLRTYDWNVIAELTGDKRIRWSCCGVVVLWSLVEASSPPSRDRDGDGATSEQRTTIKMGMKTIRHTITWLRGQALDYIEVPSRTTGHLWGVFHRRAWKAHARRTSPKGPVGALVNRTIWQALVKRTYYGADIERREAEAWWWRGNSRGTIHSRYTLSRMAESLSAPYGGTLLQRQARLHDYGSGERWRSVLCIWERG